jgi:hypothetical protein
MPFLTCTLQDYKGKSATVKVKVPAASATVAKAKTLADTLKDHSDAKVVGYGVSLDFTGDDVSTGKYDRVLQTLTMLYEDQDGNSRRLSIPAPRDEDVNEDQEPDSDWAEDAKDLLVSLGAVKSATYQGGGLKSRLPSKEARSKVTTGV